MPDLRRRLQAAETAVEEITTAEQAVDDRSEIQKWVAILRMILVTAGKVEQTPSVVTATGRIQRTLAMLEPVEFEANFAHTEYACQGARYQLSWPGFPETWHDPTYEDRIANALAIDIPRRSLEGMPAKADATS